MYQQEKENDLDQLLTTQQTSLFTGLAEKTLQKFRLLGSGPKYVRISSRAVRYRKRDLLAWIEERVRTSTSDQKGA